MRNGTFSAALLLLAPAALHAQSAAADTSVKITVGAFVDGYYAWDFQRPANFERSFASGALFTTQPTRHNEFNINLAFVELKADAARLRGRIALQAGTSVASNYSGEPGKGQVSGPSLAQHIQEAVVGVKVGRSVWVDGGVFFSHIGMETWTSRDNPTYTRSLVADYSPYYQSGVKVTWAASPKLTAQVDVVNGWQNISENNSGKGAGVRIDFTPTPASTISYYNLISQEAGTKLRIFNGIGAKVVQGRATLLGELDVGTQDDSNGNGGPAQWYGFTVIARAQVAPTVGVSARLERFDDKHQVLISTGATDAGSLPPFRGNGASIGLDWLPQSRLMWRNEVRGFANNSPAFNNPGSSALSKRDIFAVSSLALTF